MIMLMNLDTLVAMRNPPLMNSVWQEMYAIVGGELWRMLIIASPAYRLSLSVAQKDVYLHCHSASYRPG